MEIYTIPRDWNKENMSQYLFKEFRLPEYTLIKGYTHDVPVDKLYKETTVDGERRIVLPAGPEYDD